jgi:predicted nucleotide-binding protein
MARKPPQTTVGQPTVSARQGYEKLRIQLERGESLQANDERGFGTWVTTTQHWVEQAFGERSAKALEFFNAQGINVPVVVGSTDFGEILRESLALRLNLLRSFTEVLKETAELQESQTDHAASPRREPTATNKVFLVHGRDDGVKQTVARFLEKLDLVPIILHEQPNSGRTIIEKFEAYTDVAFAVVLLTPDDRGGLADAPFEQQSPRARQNVVLELGYFLGKLGREGVCALYKEGTEIPSDYQGVAFVKLDEPGAWKLDLARELKVVLPTVDLNRAFG